MSNQFFQLFFFLFNLFFKVLSHSFNIGFSDTPCSNSSCLARKYSSTQSIDSEFHMLHSGYLNLEFFLFDDLDKLLHFSRSYEGCLIPCSSMLDYLNYINSAKGFDQKLKFGEIFQGIRRMLMRRNNIDEYNSQLRHVWNNYTLNSNI